jgi:hypothetical protein
MNCPLDLTLLVPATMMAGEDEAETAVLRAMLEDAGSYLRSFAWCPPIAKRYFGMGIGGEFQRTAGSQSKACHTTGARNGARSSTIPRSVLDASRQQLRGLAMGTTELQKAFQVIENQAQSDFHGPQPDALIRHAEDALGVTFPPSYLEFLRRLGAGHVTGCEFYGIIHDDFENSGVPDAIWLTLNRRRTAGAPHALVFVCDTGDGGYYAIDTSRESADGEMPVVLWWVDQPLENCEVVASDFGAFLLEQVQWSAEEWPRERES